MSQILRTAYLECVIPAQNRQAFYSLLAEKDLFGFVLSRRWGRIGTKGRAGLRLRFPSAEETLKEFDKVLSLRLSHHYCVVEKTKRRLSYPLSCAYSERILSAAERQRGELFFY